MAFTIWNSGDLANVTLDATDLIATASTASAGVRGVDGYTGGKYYIEYTINTITGSVTGAGIANGAATLSTTSTTQANLAYIRLDGRVMINGTSAATLTALSAGALVGMAVDLDNQLIWVRNGAAGSWNASGTANPSTTTGGLSLSSVMGRFYNGIFPLAAFNAASDKITANFGASAFSGVVPTNFSAGWTAVVAGSTTVRDTQTGAETWMIDPGTIHASQVGAETWMIDPGTIRASQIGAEVWVTKLISSASQIFIMS